MPARNRNAKKAMHHKTDVKYSTVAGKTQDTCDHGLSTNKKADGMKNFVAGRTWAGEAQSVSMQRTGRSTHTPQRTHLKLFFNSESANTERRVCVESFRRDLATATTFVGSARPAGRVWRHFNEAFPQTVTFVCVCMPPLVDCSVFWPKKKRPVMPK